MESADGNWASGQQQEAAVRRARQHIQKRTAAALANDLCAMRLSAAPGDGGVLQLECRRRRGDVDLGPQLLTVHPLVLRARGAEWLIEKQHPQVAGQSSNVRSTVRTCPLPARSCEVLLHFLYTGDCPDAEADLPLSDLQELYAVAAAHKIAGLTESLGKLLRPEEPQQRRPGPSVGRARGTKLRGRGRGGLRSARPSSAKAAPRQQDVVTASEKWLCEDMRRLLDTQDGTDCVLLCPAAGDTTQFRCHRALLAARSDYFRTMLSDRWHRQAASSGGPGNDEQDFVVTMAEPANVVAALISWIYGSLAPLPGDVLPELLTAADYYGLLGLQPVVALSAKLEHCHLFLHAPCPECAQGVPLWLQLAECHGLIPLRNGCIRWLARHFRTAWLSDQFASLPDDLCAAVAEELRGTLDAEVATRRFLDAGAALSGGVVASSTGKRGAKPMQMLTQARDAALGVIAVEFEKVACTLPFVQLCSGVGWQEHLVVDEIAPALSQVNTRANRKQRRAALARLARAVEQEGICPACDGPLTTKATACEGRVDDQSALTMLDCGHMFHERCYSPFRSTSCASCQAQYAAPKYMSVGSDVPRDSVRIRELPAASEGESVRAVAQKHRAVAALLHALEEPAARTLQDACVDRCGNARGDSGGKGAGHNRRADATGKRPTSRPTTSTPPKTQADAQLTDPSNLSPESGSADSGGGVATPAAGSGPGWLRGTIACVGTTPTVSDPSCHRLDSSGLAMLRNDGVSVDGVLRGGATQRDEAARHADARRHLLRGRRRGAAKYAL